jgi:hypothetical protein
MDEKPTDLPLWGSSNNARQPVNWSSRQKRNKNAW